MHATARQNVLFETSNPTNGFRDPSFGGNKRLPLHRWVPWVAGFSSEFVADCFSNYLSRQRFRNAWVLDPFAGVGTTLVEGFTHGLNVLGFEINPYAALASRLKLEAAKVSTRSFERELDAFRVHMKRVEKGLLKREPSIQAPTGFSGRTELFSPKVERKVLFALEHVALIPNTLIREMFRLALGSVMVSFSNYTYEPSLTRRIAVGKPEITDAPVGAVVCSKLELMLEDTRWLQQRIQALGYSPESQVIPKSIFAAQSELGRSGFVDLVVTSPPYLNNYHYPRNTRPQLHWLGFASGRGYNGAGEDQSFGKFWQTVRDGEPVPLGPQLPELSQILGQIRDRGKEKGPYGGPGWANYAATYFNDTHRFCNLLARLLRPGATAVIVLGNSVIQGVEVRTDYFFGKAAELCGLKFEETVLLRKKRTGSSIIKSSVRVEEAAEKTVLYESAIILRK